MGLMCSCDVEGDYKWYYEPPGGYSELGTKRAKRCCSCVSKIKPGDTVGRFIRYRNARDGLEHQICGDTVPLASWYMCEPCLDLYFSISELGYCIELDGDSMQDLLKEYVELNNQN